MKSQKGITLIALVITIIVMLILVAVTIAMAVDGGLFGKATEAGAKSNIRVQEESELGKGFVNVSYKGATTTTSADQVDEWILQQMRLNGEI